MNYTNQNKLGEETEKSLRKLERKLKYEFKNKGLLLLALTHRSFSAEKKGDHFGQHNETLEFLGDSVLSLVAAEQLFKDFSKESEGLLSQLRAQYIKQETLAHGARKIGLSSFLRVSHSMQASGSVELSSVLSDAVEAIIGAVYLDQGLSFAREVVMNMLGPLPKKLEQEEKDARMILQERAQRASSQTPVYSVVDWVGPPHEPIFEVHVLLNKSILGKGKGKNKKLASLAAAKNALKRLNGLNENEIVAFFNEKSS